MSSNSNNEAAEAELPTAIFEPQLWVNKGWMARIIKSEEDDGWAVAMIKDGESEPVLVGPWTMGRDKKNPKPLDASAFAILVKTASEVLRRHEQHLHALHHQQLSLFTEGGEVTVTLDIVPDEDDPHALLTAIGPDGESMAQVRVEARFRLSPASAAAWIENDFRRPG